MATSDVTVMGAGILGLSVAWACARRGAKVQVIDPFGIGAGSSGGVVGALSPHVPESWNPKKAFQLDALLMAPDWWATVAAQSGIDPGFARTGRLQPLADDKSVQLARVRAVNAAMLWRGAATWELVAQDESSGWRIPSATGLVVRDSLSARIAPRLALSALAAAIRAAGGTVRPDGPPKGVVVWATGFAGLTDAMPPLGSGVKGQAALLRHDAQDAPQLFVDGLHIVPHANGTVAVGSTSERDWTDAQTTDAQLDALVAAARAHVPALDTAPVIDRWAGIRPRATSRAPLLGHHPARPGAFIANGGFKIGFGIAPMVGEVMADLILEGRDRIPAGMTG
jgi:glycine oxidase